MWITQLSDSSEQRQSAPTLFHNWTFNVRVLELTSWAPQLAQVRNMSIGEFWHSVRNIRNIRICMGKKPIVTVTYKNQRISMKNSLPYIKGVLRPSCVVHGPIYGRFMGCIYSLVVLIHSLP